MSCDKSAVVALIYWAVSPLYYFLNGLQHCMEPVKLLTSRRSFISDFGLNTLKWCYVHHHPLHFFLITQLILCCTGLIPTTIILFIIRGRLISFVQSININRKKLLCAFVCLFDQRSTTRDSVFCHVSQRSIWLDGTNKQDCLTKFCLFIVSHP